MNIRIQKLQGDLLSANQVKHPDVACSVMRSITQNIYHLVLYLEYSYCCIMTIHRPS